MGFGKYMLILVLLLPLVPAINWDDQLGLRLPFNNTVTDFSGNSIEIIYNSNSNYTAINDTENNIFQSFTCLAGDCSNYNFIGVHDEDFGTWGAVETNTNSGTSVAHDTIYENFTIPTTTISVNVTYKYQFVGGAGVNRIGKYNLSCVNKTDRSLIDFYYHEKDDISAQTNTNETPSDCISTDGIFELVHYREAYDWSTGAEYQNVLLFETRIGYTYVIPNYTTDKNNIPNESILLNGIDEYINTGNIMNLDNGFTISVWINKSENLGGTVVVTNKGYVDGQIIINSGINTRMYLHNGTDQRNVAVLGVSDYYNWHHYLWTYNYSTGDMKSYWNGALNETDNILGFDYTEIDFNLGKTFDSDIVQNFFNGSLDEIRIYNRSLAAWEILNLYNAFNDFNFNVTSNISSYSSDIFVPFDVQINYSNFKGGGVKCGVTSDSSNLSCTNVSSSILNDNTITSVCTPTLFINPQIINTEPFCTNSINTFCYQETANVTSDCGDTNTGTYANKSQFVYMNYTKPKNALSSSLWQVKHGTLPVYNASIAPDCWAYDNNILMLRFLAQVSGGSRSVGQCFNGTWKNTTNSENDEGIIVIVEGNVNRTFDGDYDTGVYFSNSQGFWAVAVAGQPSESAMFFEEAMFWNFPETTIISESQDLTVYYNGTINFTVFNAETLELIQDQNITIQLWNEDQSFALTTNSDNNTGKAFVSDIPIGLLRINFFGTGYDVNNIYLTLNISSTSYDVNLYLTNSTATTIKDVMLNVDDDVGADLPNAQIRIFAQNASNGFFFLITTIFTDINGQKLVQLVRDSTFYKFTIFLGASKCYETLNAFTISASTDSITFRCIVDSEYIEDRDAYDNFNFTLMAQNTSNTTGWFRLEAVAGETGEICLKVFLNPARQNTLINQSCVNGTSILTTININSSNDTRNSVYNGIVTWNPRDHSIETALGSTYLYFYKLAQMNWGDLGLIMYIFLTIFIFLAVIKYPTAAVMVPGAMFALATWTGLIRITQGKSLGIIAIGICAIIAWAIETRNR